MRAFLHIHRVHRVTATTIRNFGTVLSICDRIAGTSLSPMPRRRRRSACPGALDTYSQRFPDAVRQPFRQRRPQARNRSALTVDIESQAG